MSKAGNFDAISLEDFDNDSADTLGLSRMCDIDLSNSFVPTGIFEYDFLLGGGILSNQLMTIHGVAGSGKTALMMQIAKNFHQKYPKESIAWSDEEGSFCDDWGAAAGFDVNKLIEKKLFVYKEKTKCAEDWLDMLDEMLKIDNLGLAFVDSIHALQSIEQSEKSAHDTATPGGLGKIIRSACRKVLAWRARRAREGKPALMVWVNKKVNPIAMYTRANFVGGEWVELYSSTIIKMFRESTDEANVFGISQVASAKHTMQLDKLRQIAGTKISSYLSYTPSITGVEYFKSVKEPDFIYDRARDFNLFNPHSKVYAVTGEKFDKKEAWLEWLYKDKASLNFLKSLLIYCYGRKVYAYGGIPKDGYLLTKISPTEFKKMKELYDTVVAPLEMKVKEKKS